MLDDIPRIGVTEARRHFGKLVNDAYYKGKWIVLTRDGKDIAVLMSVDDYKILDKGFALKIEGH